MQWLPCWPLLVSSADSGSKESILVIAIRSDSALGSHHVTRVRILAEQSEDNSTKTWTMPAPEFTPSPHGRHRHDSRR
jgi:hypothetical protein